MGKRKKGDKINGWINLDKPYGMGSTQAVSKVRRLLNAQKAGHAGTLDPLASGILPIALGEATKTIPYIQDALKTYTFTITWGENRDTLDAEGAVTATSDKRPSIDDIQTALPQFIGDITQIPPKYSAVKIDGARAYDLARDGEDFEVRAREVFVQSLEMLPPSIPPVNGGEETSFIMTCGKGTYVRAIARDLAETLSTCGYVSALRRTAVGMFTEENAFCFDDDADDTAHIQSAMLPTETALHDMVTLTLNSRECSDLRHGRSLNFVSRADHERIAHAGNGDEVLAIYDMKPVAICRYQNAVLKPIRVFDL